jgi:hypothetical protein
MESEFGDQGNPQRDSAFNGRALTIIAEAGDPSRFHHHRQFLKFCGLDLSTQQSGQYRGQTRLSKFGNARLRRTLWIAGQVAIRQRENGFRHKFERYIARDRDNPDLRRKAMTAITAKMARVVHAVIKNCSDKPSHFSDCGQYGTNPSQPCQTLITHSH